MAHRHGYVPLASLFVDRVPERLYPTVRETVQAGTGLHNTHAFSYYELLTYDFGRGEPSDADLASRFDVLSRGKIVASAGHQEVGPDELLNFYRQAVSNGKNRKNGVG